MGTFSLAPPQNPEKVAAANISTPPNAPLLLWRASPWLEFAPAIFGAPRVLLSLKMVRYTLSKSERLSSIKAIEKLFKEGKSLARFPVRLVWAENIEPDAQEFPIQVMFSASKKKFSRAVDRNRLKRLMREGYRLAKPGLYGVLPPGKKYHLALIYTGTEILDFEAIQKSITQALERWLKSLSELPSELKES